MKDGLTQPRMIEEMRRFGLFFTLLLSVMVSVLLVLFDEILN
jgi:hypothetical protein